MAKVKNPLLSMEARGALTGIEYRQNQNGSIVGRRSISTYSNSEAQQWARHNLQAAHAAWDALPDESKAWWKNQAAPPQTGRQFFIGVVTRWWLRLPGDIPVAEEWPGTPTMDNIIITPMFMDVYFLLIDWDWNEQDPTQKMGYVLETFSNREKPTLSKMRYAGTGDYATNYAVLLIKKLTPVVHVRFDFVNAHNGLLMGRSLYRIEVAWDKV